MELFSKKQTYTLKEFLNYLRSKESIELEKKAKILYRHKQYRRVAVFTIAILMECSVNALAAGNPFDSVGSRFWFYVKSFAKWACLICAGIDIIKSLNAGDSKNIGKVIFKYIVAYAAFSILPWFFKEIDTAFSSMK
ncbi:hypothetical protein [Clostridium manihotivorum]|uniref:Uncharacterized protein n=1 Tax=Clostridium manihotivorum TaxID=2320868 RepID=A0A3R5QS77_9CLOT|nr:hypothetical protein [Clostridium manihotivorum]QAA31263.1 hypothetical protein C1I91_06160 [Clostridium manihotivorum]